MISEYVSLENLGFGIGIGKLYNYLLFINKQGIISLAYLLYKNDDDDDEKTNSLPTGLINYGTTCFANSAL